MEKQVRVVVVSGVMMAIAIVGLRLVAWHWHRSASEYADEPSHRPELTTARGTSSIPFPETESPTESRVFVPQWPGDRAPGRAVLEKDGQRVTPARYDTRFERIVVRPHQELIVTMSWPHDTLSEDVLVHAIHGGRIDGGANAKRFALGSDRTVQFTVELGNAPGLYEVLLRRGTKEEVLEFWVPLGVAAIDQAAVPSGGAQ